MNTEKPSDRIQLSTGSFTHKELELFLSLLPVELSFVDKDDTVRFFSNKTERFFLRSPAAINKDMRVCHPKKYLPMVEQILADFKSGTQSHARFWRSDHKGSFICIDYHAMRDADGTYMGTLEMIQDIADLKQLDGDRNELIYD